MLIKNIFKDIENRNFLSHKLLGLKPKIVYDKRANAWINVLVLLVLATFAYAGYTFVSSSGKISAEISGLNVLNDVYFEENNFKFSFKETGEKAVEKTYLEFLSDEKPTAESFFINFQKTFEEYGIDKNYLKRENFIIEGNLLKVKIDDWRIQKEFKSKESSAEILYRKSFNFEFSLK